MLEDSKQRVTDLQAKLNKVCIFNLKISQMLEESFNKICFQNLFCFYVSQRKML